MNRQITFLLFGFTLLFNQVSGQSFKLQFENLIFKKDTGRIQQFLEKWEKTDSNDPELFIANFNHCMLKSKMQVVTPKQDPNNKNVLQNLNKNTTEEELSDFILGTIYYEPVSLSIGFGWISKGIEKHPDRLDMRFEKIRMLGEIEDYENFIAEIIKTIDYSNVNKNKWIWTDGKALDNPREFMLDSIEDYQVKYDNSDSNEELEYKKRIAETALRYYPDHIESLSNLSKIFMLQERYDKALEPLLKAEKLNPEGYFVLCNIAQVYRLTGDNKNAIKYYELVLIHGEEQYKIYAQEQLDHLIRK